MHDLADNRLFSFLLSIIGMTQLATFNPPPAKERSEKYLIEK